jgi:hypothetical protein
VQTRAIAYGQPSLPLLSFFRDRFAHPSSRMIEAINPRGSVCCGCGHRRLPNVGLWCARRAFAFAVISTGYVGEQRASVHFALKSALWPGPLKKSPALARSAWRIGHSYRRRLKRALFYAGSF